MRVISQAKLKTFYAKHSNTEQALRAWYDEAKKARWETPQQIKDQFRTASFVGHNRVAFNIWEISIDLSWRSLTDLEQSISNL
jgi:mRNA interferase HigB